MASYVLLPSLLLLLLLFSPAPLVSATDVFDLDRNPIRNGGIYHILINPNTTDAAALNVFPNTPTNNNILFYSSLYIIKEKGITKLGIPVKIQHSDTSSSPNIQMSEPVQISFQFGGPIPTELPWCVAQTPISNRDYVVAAGGVVSDPSYGFSFESTPPGSGRDEDYTIKYSDSSFDNEDKNNYVGVFEDNQLLGIITAPTLFVGFKKYTPPSPSPPPPSPSPPPPSPSPPPPSPSPPPPSPSPSPPPPSTIFRGLPIVNA